MSRSEDPPAGSDAAILELENRIAALTREWNAARRAASGRAVPDYRFQTLSGEVRLSDLFAGRDQLLAIHNMGQGCRYCTLWADGLNGFLPHLESAMAVVLLSRDDPETQRRFTNSRAWRFRLASHRGGDYIREQTTCPGHDNAPGAVLYEKEEGEIRRKNAVAFGSGDMFCPAWNLLAMAGRGVDDWTPQFTYWQRPKNSTTAARTFSALEDDPWRTTTKASGSVT